MYKLWLTLVLIAACVAVWFLGTAIYHLVGYWKLGPTTPAKILEWSIKEISESKFAMEASYVYQVGGESYMGKTLFKTPTYLNPYSAEEDIKKWEGLSWHVWYQNKHPEVSSLQKHFPSKEITQAVLTLGVCIYFYFLRNLSDTETSSRIGFWPRQSPRV